MIKLSNINISFERPIFINAQIELTAGAFNVLIGESGCGKTTLLNEIGLLNEKLNSDYLFFDNKLNDHSDFALKRRIDIGYVFQENYLFEKLTVKENIIFAANLSGIELSDDEVYELLSKTKTQELIDKKITEISGGERQRVAISFALAKKPKLLLFDEPTSYLDQENCYLVIDVIQQIVHSNETIVFVVTHDKRVIASADNIFKIKDNKIVCDKKIKNYLKFNDLCKRNDILSKKAIKGYISKSKKHISKLLYLILSLVTVILLFNVGYSNYYKEYVEKNIINNTMEEIRVYYGPNKRKSVNGINKYISYDILNKIKNIDGIRDAIPFYEINAHCNDNEILIQTYYNELSSKVNKSYENNSNIYVSSSMKGLLDNDELSFMYFDKLYDLKINGILEDTYQNGYSNNGNKIVYIPVSKFNELFRDSVEPYLYILRFDNSVDFNKVVEQIKNIDNEITIYSTIDIDKLQLLNSQLLAGV